MAPVAGFSKGQIALVQCGVAAAVSVGVAAASEGLGPSAHTIHSPFRNSGTSRANVARRRNMTVRKTMPEPPSLVKQFCRGSLGGEDGIEFAQKSLELHQRFPIGR